MSPFALAVLVPCARRFSQLVGVGRKANFGDATDSIATPLFSAFVDDAVIPTGSSLVRLSRKLQGRVQEPGQSARRSLAGPLREVGDDTPDSLRA